MQLLWQWLQVYSSVLREHTRKIKQTHNINQGAQNISPLCVDFILREAKRSLLWNFFRCYWKITTSHYSLLKSITWTTVTQRLHAKHYHSHYSVLKSPLYQFLLTGTLIEHVKMKCYVFDRVHNYSDQIRAQIWSHNNKVQTRSIIVYVYISPNHIVQPNLVICLQLFYAFNCLSI